MIRNWFVKSDNILNELNSRLHVETVADTKTAVYLYLNKYRQQKQWRYNNNNNHN